MPTRWAWPARGIEAAQRGLRDRACGSRPRSAAGPAPVDRRRPPRRRAGPAGGGIGRRGLPHPSRAAGRWHAGSRRPRRSSCPARTPRPTPASFRAGMSSSGMIPPAVTRTSSRPASRSRREIRGSSVMCAPDRIDRPDDVDVLLERRRGDHLGRLAQARVDDLEALVAQAPREHLGAAVVAVEAGLRDEHLDRSVGHRLDCRLGLMPPAEPLPEFDLYAGLGIEPGATVDAVLRAHRAAIMRSRRATPRTWPGRSRRSRWPSWSGCSSSASGQAS